MEHSYSKNQEKYLVYLKRVQRKEHAKNEFTSLHNIHQRYLSREVAREYGLIEEEIRMLDNALQRHEGGK